VPDSYIARYLKKGLPLQEARIYGMITAVDENLGRLLAALERWNLAGNTVLIFMSDNGGVSRYHSCGLRGNKGSVYEGGVRVPFFVRWPGQFPAGAVVETPAQHIDIFPTLCESIGAPLPSDRKLDGRSLLALLRTGGGAALHEHLFHQWNRVRPLLEPPADPSQAPPEERKAFRPNWAVMDARGFKLHATGELYDLGRDPGEQHDIARQQPELARQLRRRFEEFFRDVTAGQHYRRVPIEVGREDENPVELDLAWSELAGKKLRPAWRHYNRDTIEDWSEPGDGLRWRIEVVAPGRYEVILEYGCAPQDAGSRYEVTAGRARLEGTARATAGPLIFESFRAGELVLERGPAVLEMRALAVRGHELMRLHKFWLRRLA
ncbi:MAG: sulfatase-like hydrolase/transferase, partial [Bryobacteraceae bacterium]